MNKPTRDNEKGVGYWLFVGAVIVGSMWLSDVFEERQLWMSLRYPASHLLQQLSPIAVTAYVGDTVLIMVSDAEYWGEELVGRSPIRRDYLANLLNVIDEASPSVIAVDFSLRSTISNTDKDYAYYANENALLFESIRAIARKRPVVLPRTVSGDEAVGYFEEADIFDGHLPIATSSERTLNGSVKVGHVALPTDTQELPLQIEPENHKGTTVDSFSLAIVRAHKHGALDGLNVGPEASPYHVWFLPERFFPNYTAGEILAMDTSELAEKLRSKVVIIGGGWHVLGVNRGELVDTYDTPVGELPGALIHANYIESIVYRRLDAPLGHRASKVLEAVASLGFAIGLAWTSGLKRKLVVAATTLIAVFGANVLFLVLLGRSFDLVISLGALVAHAILVDEFELRIARRSLLQTPIQAAGSSGAQDTPDLSE